MAKTETALKIAFDSERICFSHEYIGSVWNFLKVRFLQKLVLKYYWFFGAILRC